MFLLKIIRLYYVHFETFVSLIQDTETLQRKVWHFLYV